MVKKRAGFDPVIKTCHWLTLVLITAIFAAAWTAHSGLVGEWYQPVMQLHRSLGLTVLAVTVFRLIWRQRSGAPKLPNDLHPVQKLTARITEMLLYLLLLIQPLLGLLQTSARGQSVEFYFLVRLPPVIGIDRPFAHQLHDLHALCANALLILIGMHSAAALFHHFIRRDDVLRTMLPTRLLEARLVRKPSALG